MTTIVAAALLLAVIAYAVFGGADFGAGFWDLFAGGDRRGAEPRRVIERAIGPVWEGNHVWLIFIFVVLWTGFSEAYASIWLTLFVPLTIAALGIVLRGAGFAFRKAVTTTRYQRIFGGAFAIPSLIVPYCMGAVVGAVASGRVPAGGIAGDPVASWVNPTSILGGILGVRLPPIWRVSISSSTRLEWARRAWSTTFAVETVGMAVVAGLVAGGGIFVLRDDAEYVFDGLVTRALPIVIASALLGVISLVMLVRRSHARLTRVTARPSGRNHCSGLGGGPVGLHPPRDADLEQASAPEGTLGTLVRRGGARRGARGPGFHLAVSLGPAGNVARGKRGKCVIQPKTTHARRS